MLELRDLTEQEIEDGIAYQRMLDMYEEEEEEAFKAFMYLENQEAVRELQEWIHKE